MQKMILSITSDELSDAGYATPLATLQTAVWAGLGESEDTYFDCFTPEVKQSFQPAQAMDAETTGLPRQRAGVGHVKPRVRCLRVYAQHFASDTEVEVEYELNVSGEGSLRWRQPLKKIGEAWKISGHPQEVR